MKTFIITLIAAVIVIGGFTLLRSKIREQAEFKGIVMGANGKIDGKYALKDIINLDEPYKCEFEKKDGDSKVRGEIFIAPGAKVRGNFDIDSSSNPEPFKSYFIIRDGDIYNWTSLLNIGFQSAVSENLSGSAVIPFDEKIKYECVMMGKVDQTLFSPPANIVFQNK